ncbi:hypothetical protein Tco_0938136 [Tanacetum coccineum]|uniref:Uncharacterized protein n=1 Tax=Tanacetum coccineum TaxID=301880 RepID=A0ABQ5DGA0_9ASTR
MAEEVGVETVEEEVMDSLLMDSVSLNGEDGGVENKSSMGSRLEIVVEWLLGGSSWGLLMYIRGGEIGLIGEEKRVLD